MRLYLEHDRKGKGEEDEDGSDNDNTDNEQADDKIDLDSELTASNSTVRFLFKLFFQHHFGIRIEDLPSLIENNAQ